MKFLDMVYRIVCWTLGLVFIWAGGVKLLSPKDFAVLIEAYGIVPDLFLMPVAVFLPALEVIGGLGLLFDIKGSLGLISGLLVLFLIILGYAIYMGLDVDCGCFGPEDPEARAFHGLRTAFYRDLGLMAGILFMAAWRKIRGIQPKPAARYLNLNILKKEELA